MTTINETLEIVILNTRQVDSLNGAELGLLRREGFTVVILPVGEKKHKWSSTSEGPAFRAVAWRNEDNIEITGWVSPNSLAGGEIYLSVPENWEFVASNDDEWWIAKDMSNTPSQRFGLSQAGLPSAVDLEDKILKHAVLVEVKSAPKGYTGKLIPKTQTALDKIKAFNPKASAFPNKSAKNFPTSGWESKGAWIGKARWATGKDLEGHLDLKKYSKYLFSE